MDEVLGLNEWRAGAEKLFGGDPLDWVFVCPVCRHEQSVRDYREAGAPQNAVGAECIGRHTADMRATQRAFVESDKGPCDYAGYGLLHLNPVRVRGEDDKVHEVFAFAEVARG